MGTKTRQISSLTRAPIYYKVNPGNTLALYSQYSTPKPFYQTLESLTDSQGSDGKFRSCTHKKVHFSLQGNVHAPMKWPVFPAGTFEEEHGLMYRGACESMATLKNYAWDSVPSHGIDLNDFGLQARAAMLPSLSAGGFSVLNFLHELKDFAHLGSTLQSTVAALVRGRYHALKQLGSEAAWQAIGATPYDSIGRKSTGAILSWKLAWLPLFSDLKRLLNLYKEHVKKISDFSRRQRQRQQRYFGKTISLPVQAVSGNSGWQSGKEWAYRATYSAQPYPTARVTAVMRYRYSLPGGALDQHQLVESWLDLAGINANPAIVWNAIPFSFLVDYLYNVGGKLASLRVDNVQAVTDVIDFSVSVKATRIIKSKIEVQKNSNPGGLIPTPDPCTLVAHSVVYERLTMPQLRLGIFPNLEPSTPSFGKGAVVASLTHQRLSPVPPRFSIWDSRGLRR